MYIHVFQPQMYVENINMGRPGYKASYYGAMYEQHDSYLITIYA